MLTSNPNNTTANSKLSGSLTWMGLALFWLAVFLLNAGPHWEAYKSNREMIETAGLTTSIQFVIAVVVLKLLLPKFLETNKNLAFAVSLLVLVFALAQIGILIRFYYLEPMYPDSYTA